MTAKKKQQLDPRRRNKKPHENMCDEHTKNYFVISTTLLLKQRKRTNSEGKNLGMKHCIMRQSNNLKKDTRRCKEEWMKT